MARAAATIGQEQMQDLTQALAKQASASAVVNILPYRLKALERRKRMARAAALAIMPAPAVPAPVPKARLFHVEPGPLRAGIRHSPSGRMTVIHAGLRTAMAMLAERAERGSGLVEDARLEAILVDGERQVFAGFWPH
jgi:hypothetical protein